jgi:hypothetical protein
MGWYVALNDGFAPAKRPLGFANDYLEADIQRAADPMPLFISVGRAANFWLLSRTLRWRAICSEQNGQIILLIGIQPGSGRSRASQCIQLGV